MTYFGQPSCPCQGGAEMCYGGKGKAFNCNWEPLLATLGLATWDAGGDRKSLLSPRII